MAPPVPLLWVAAPLWGECWVGCCPAVASLVGASLVGASQVAASQAAAYQAAAYQAAVAPAGLARPGAGAVAFRAAVGPLEGQEST
jgi:hypothetical protein